jgi:hypothetical protein
MLCFGLLIHLFHYVFHCTATAIEYDPWLGVHRTWRCRYVSFFNYVSAWWPWSTPSWGAIRLLVLSYSVRLCRFASLLIPSDVLYRFHLFSIFFDCYWTLLFSSISSSPEVDKVLGYRSLHSKHLSLPGLPPHSHRCLRISFMWFLSYLVIS